jgi:hypothetical protein
MYPFNRDKFMIRMTKYYYIMVYTGPSPCVLQVLLCFIDAALQRLHLPLTAMQQHPHSRVPCGSPLWHKVWPILLKPSLCVLQVFFCFVDAALQRLDLTLVALQQRQPPSRVACGTPLWHRFGQTSLNPHRVFSKSSSASLMLPSSDWISLSKPCSNGNHIAMCPAAPTNL